MESGRMERFAERLFLLSAAASVAVTAAIFGFLLFLGLPLLSGGQLVEILTGPWLPHRGAYGVLPMAAGTALVASLAIAFAFPVALGCAAFISVTGPRRPAAVIRRIVQAMTGVPTVIYGFCGIFLVVPQVRQWLASGSGMCILTAALVLAILVSPTLVIFFCNSFDSVPAPYRRAAAALGATKAQQLIHVTLPCSWKGVITGLVLGFGRAIGDTLVALMLAGNAVRMPGSVLDSARTLTAHIALVKAADYESFEFRSIFVCGLLLYLFSVVASLAVRALPSARSGEDLNV